MPIDPRINCAAEICCQPQSPASHAAACSILCDLGMTENGADAFARKMRSAGLCIMPQELADVIAKISDHPARSSAPTLPHPPFAAA